MRRPAGHREVPLDIGEAWRRGEVVNFHQLLVEEIIKGPRVVVEEGTYMEGNLTLAGTLGKVEAAHGDTRVAIVLEGTSSEVLLRAHSTGGKQFVLHRCPSDCDGKETSETLIHAKRIRQVLPGVEEEPWTTNLVVVPKTPGEVDELKSLRNEARGMGPEGGLEEKAKKKSSTSTSSSRKGKKKKKKEEKKRRKKDKEKKKKRAEQEQTEKESFKDQEMRIHNGKTPMTSGVKDPAIVLCGTGLDPRERVRRRVQKSARRYLRSKSSKDSKTSSSSDSGTSSTASKDPRDTIFTDSTKVRKLAEQFPGSLATEGLTAMRDSLLQIEGYQEERSHLRPTALLYFRSVLQKKSAGAQGRELLTHCTAIDMLMNGRIAGALDLLMQRVKSIESTQQGVHYTISQRLEVLPQEGLTLTGRQEMKEAQRESYSDSRLKWLSGQADKGGPTRDVKGGKGKDGKNDKGGKTKGKGDGSKKEDAEKKAK